MLRALEVKTAEVSDDTTASSDSYDTSVVVSFHLLCKYYMAIIILRQLLDQACIRNTGHMG